jgi:hypothetical protein
MESQILTDPMAEPNGIILEDALGKSYKTFQAFAAKINELGRTSSI